jgi:hypothetical protein
MTAATELPPRSFCAGGCGASFLDLVGDDGISVDADELARWTIVNGPDGYMQAWCPYFGGI